MVNILKYLIFLPCLLSALFSGAAIAAKPVYLVLSDNTPLYDEVTTLIKHGLSADVPLQVVYADDFKGSNVSSNSLLVPVGRRAAEDVALIEGGNSVIYSFIEAQTLNRILEGRPKQHWQASVINQPLERLIRTAKPLIRNDYRNKLLIVIAESNLWARKQIEELPSDLREFIEILVVEKGEVAARLIDDSFYKVAAVVAVNDTAIWSGNSAKWILHQAYSYQVPVVGYAQTFQKAGAMIAVYSSLSRIAETTSGLINNWMSTDQLSGQGFVYSDYQVEVNEFIARALSYQPDKIKIKHD
ncbi:MULTISPECIES: hypothetical protein [Neptunomonas]|jgi:hypothetical protein|uniref:hypothetical protein n=1 Tax=Neptunomonas TaxID=75687 RepID=UPI000948B2C2|nr:MULTISPECIES: hypothetical protein [Neptunomonas]MDN2659457.1 hypothetical protein [Neptunomonas sp. CHC150]MDO6466556.1 hypothetical protein [Neptunomonas phycophila]